MDLSHFFHKEMLSMTTIFFANLAENKEVEEVLFKKDQNYMVIGLSINQKAENDVIISNLNASLSDLIRSYKKERKKFNLDCHLYIKDLSDITTPFKKRSDVLTTSYSYFDTTTNKNETIEFYNYYNHLKNFGFNWENDSVRYEITLSVDQKQIEKFFWCKWDKSVNLKDETTMINIYNGRSYALGDYQHAFKKFFKDELKDGKPFDKNHKIAVSHRYHENADKNF